MTLEQIPNCCKGTSRGDCWPQRPANRRGWKNSSQSRLEIPPGCMNQRGLQAAGAEGQLSPPYSFLVWFLSGSQVKLSPFPRPQLPVKSGICYSVQRRVGPRNPAQQRMKAGRLRVKPDERLSLVSVVDSQHAATESLSQLQEAKQRPHFLLSLQSGGRN